MTRQATMTQPAYLWKNARGIYFFRVRIPKQLSAYFTGTEIKKSLKTDSYRFAVKLARAYLVELDKEMEKLEQGAYSAFTVELKGKTDTLCDGEKIAVTGKIQRDLSTPNEDTTPHKVFLLNQLREEANRLEKQSKEQALFQAQLAAISSTPQPQSQLKKPNLREAQLSEVINEFVRAKVADGKWNADPKNSTHSQGRARLAQMLEVIGDKKSNEFTELDAIKIEETLPNILINPNKGALAKLPNLQEKINTETTLCFCHCTDLCLIRPSAPLNGICNIPFLQIQFS